MRPSAAQHLDYSLVINLKAEDPAEPRGDPDP